MPAVREVLETKLRAALNPVAVEVVDESHLHAGHASAPAGGESHFRVRIVSDAFVGKTRVDRHRLVNQILKDDLDDRVHALALKTLTPDEAR
ncbi:BolA family protein [Amorphus sp. 3PC139-8]|uniref:BolA family protein n=1 Tax=Amorphus sp. 3PC139-8 TaxID=2735676 RepID=UPI00345C6DE8